MDKHTKTWQRVAIWSITIVLTVGTLGFYFLIILNNNNSDALNRVQTEALQQQEEYKVDASAYKVEGKVDQLQVTDLVSGTGDAVKASDTVRVHYKGTLAQSGEKFDSSYDRGEPVEFPLSDVIQGWQQGMIGMQVGGKRRLVIPASLAYGDNPNMGKLSNADLVFEVELLAIVPPEESTQ